MMISTDIWSIFKRIGDLLNNHIPTAGAETVGDGEGFTGLDPQRSQNSIDNFVSGALNVCISDLYCFTRVFEALSTIWYSERAVDFSNTHIPKLVNVFTEAGDEIKSIYDRAVEAYNQVAEAHGVAKITPDYGLFTTYKALLDKIGEIKLQNMSPDGEIGMNIRLATNVRSESYHVYLNNKNEYDQLPEGIALYDPAGSQTQAFKSKMDYISDKIFDVGGKFYNDLLSALRKETDNVRLAKERSVDNLRGTA